MTTLFKCSVPLLVCLMIALSGTAQTVAIISSQEFNSSHKMDEAWQTIATAAGYTSEIFQSSFLSNSDLRSQADLLIISSGTGTINTAQKSNILQYVQAGGHLYIQSEYLITFDGNQLFEYLLDKTGSAFEWGGQEDNNIGPVNIINGFETGINNNELDYFWYGTHGCGDAQVIPFLEVGGNNYAFYYRSANANIGNIITNSDHDWIRRIDDNRTSREALMSNLMDVLINGLDSHDYQHPTLSIPENVNFCTDNNITAQINNANPQDIQWYLNGQPTTMGAIMDITSLSQGDSLYAQVIVPTGCLESTITSDTIIVNKENFNHSINTSFSELHPICSGSLATINITYDETLPNIRHNWFLNGKDTPIKTDYYSSDDLKDGDILEHGFTYFNGCEDIYLPTAGSVIIKWSGSSDSKLEITGQSIFCTPSTAVLNLSSLDIDSPTITWYVDNVAIGINETNIAVDATADTKVVFATIKYHSDCSGWITISTPAINVGIQSIAISLEEKADHDCINGEGFIEVYSNDNDVTYEWSNGQTGNYISNLTEGVYNVTATSSAGCVATDSYEINKITFPLVESMDITQPNCNDGYGNVQLNLSDNDLDYINVKWIDAEGQIVSTEKESFNLAGGKYQVQIDANGNCQEIYDIDINNYYQDQEVILDTMIVERGETITLQPNMYGYEGHSIEWSSNPDLNCTDCLNPEITATVSQVFTYHLISDAGCSIEKAILVLVNIRDPYYAPSAFSPNGDGINEYYKIMPRSDVSPTSSLLIFDRWGSLIHEEESDSHGWDGKSFGKMIQKGIYVFVQNFEDTMGNKYLAKGSITIFN